MSKAATRPCHKVKIPIYLIHSAVYLTGITEIFYGHKSWQTTGHLSANVAGNLPKQPLHARQATPEPAHRQAKAKALPPQLLAKQERGFLL